MGNVNHKKAETRSALQILLRNTSALEQVILNNYLSLETNKIMYLEEAAGRSFVSLH